MTNSVAISRAFGMSFGRASVGISYAFSIDQARLTCHLAGAFMGLLDVCRMLREGIVLDRGQRQQRVWVTHQRSGFGPEKWYSSIPDPSKNPTRSFLASQSRTPTEQPPGLTRFHLTCRFQSPVLFFGVFYLWSQSDMLLLCAIY